jgi:hypothetical protein
MAMDPQKCMHLLPLLQVAVKVLDSNAIAKRDLATGLSLEGLLTENLNHPNIVRTLAWAVISGLVSTNCIVFLVTPLAAFPWASWSFLWCSFSIWGWCPQCDEHQRGLL